LIWKDKKKIDASFQITGHNMTVLRTDRMTRMVPRVNKPIAGGTLLGCLCELP
jgi:hypothetical protein